LKLLQEIANFSKEEAKELLMDEVKQNTLSKIGNEPLPSMYSNYINYCIKLLDSNKREIQESIIKE
jgi:DNA-directed RNA polymerase delta subunit